MDPVSPSLDDDRLEPEPGMGPTADLGTRLGDMQIGGGGDMLVDDYEAMDDKQDAPAIITPPDSVDGDTGYQNPTPPTMANDRRCPWIAPAGC